MTQGESGARALSHQTHEGIMVILLLLLDSASIADGLRAELLGHAVVEIHD